MRISARELLGQLLDPASFVSWDRPPVTVAATPRFREDKQQAAVAGGPQE
ncbi:hypothetical protein [Nocardia brasiliensis]|nr:hypothetical protein [Nocardia brasiliensis]